MTMELGPVGNRGRCYIEVHRECWRFLECFAIASELLSLKKVAEPLGCWGTVCLAITKEYKPFAHFAEPLSDCSIIPSAGRRLAAPVAHSVHRLGLDLTKDVYPRAAYN